MTREDAIRKEVLFQSYAVRPLALSAERIHRDARKDGYDYSLQEIAREQSFLADKKLLVIEPNATGTAKLFRISAEGVTTYEQEYAP